MSDSQDRPHDPLRPHAHDPNPVPPSADPSFALELPDGIKLVLTVADLAALPRTAVPECFVVSTGHGVSGPFNFGGVALLTLLQSVGGHLMEWTQAEVISADGFGTRVWQSEVTGAETDRPILLGDTIDGRPMTRQEGLVRLIVPSERDDALRQVKWVAKISVKRD